MNGFRMKDLTFEQFAAAWIYLLSETENKLIYVPCEGDFGYEFKWRPRDDSRVGNARPPRAGGSDRQG